MTIRSRSLNRLLCVGLLLFIPGLVLAGPNEGGTLILHANPSIVFTSDTQNYCGMAALDSCSAAVTSVPWDPGRRIVFHAIAAFPAGSSPRLKVLSFGIDYDPTKFVMAARGTCADFEISGVGWPAHGTGTSQSWTPTTQTGLLTECYWFAGYAYSEQEGEDSTSVALIPHPVQHGVFVDDAFPSEVDTIAAYGQLGIGPPGTLPCPTSSGHVVWVTTGDVMNEETGPPTDDGNNWQPCDSPFDGFSFIWTDTDSDTALVRVAHKLSDKYGIQVALAIVPDGIIARVEAAQIPRIAAEAFVRTVTRTRVSDLDARP